MEGPGASGLGLGSALWPGERWTSGDGRSKSRQNEIHTGVRLHNLALCNTCAMTRRHLLREL